MRKNEKVDAEVSLISKYNKGDDLVLFTESRLELRIKVLSEGKNSFVFKYKDSIIRFEYGVEGFEVFDELGVFLPGFTLTTEESDFFENYANQSMRGFFRGTAKKGNFFLKNPFQRDLFETFE